MMPPLIRPSSHPQAPLSGSPVTNGFTLQARLWLNGKGRATVVLLLLMAVMVGGVVSPLRPSHSSGALTGWSSAYAEDNLAKGIEAYEKGWYKEAIQAFEQAVAETPTNALAHLWLARALKKQGGDSNLSRARDEFRQVLNNDPNNAEALASLGEVLTWDVGTRREGEEMLKKAIAIDPSNVDAVNALVQMYMWDQRYAEALPYARQLQSVRGGDKTWLKQYAFILTQTGHYNEALEIYENQLQVRNSTDLSVLENYALILYQAGRRQEAEALVADLKDQVSRLSGNMRYVHMLALSGLSYAMGNYAESYQMDREVISRAPKLNHHHVQMRMARSLAQLGRYDEAIAIMYALYQQGKLDNYGKLEFASLLLDAKIPEARWPQPNLPRALYTEVRDMSTNDPGVLMSLARLGAQMGEPFSTTWAMYERALQQSNYDVKYLHEAANFLKSQGNRPDLNLTPQFKMLLSHAPQDVELKLALAEYLSWNEATRDEAIALMTAVLQEHPEMKGDVERLIAENVQWMTPSPKTIPYLKFLMTVYPENKAIQVALAKAYMSQSSTATEGFRMMEALHTQYPDDAQLTKEYINALLSTQGKNRKLALRHLGQLLETTPTDANLKFNYAQLLIYDRQYEKGIAVLDELIAENPAFGQAVAMKGYALLWSGKRFVARDYLEDARTNNPSQPAILVALARVYREIGRFDKAMLLLEEAKRYLSPAAAQQQDAQAMPAVEDQPEGSAEGQTSALPEKARRLLAQATLTLDVDLPTTNEPLIPVSDVRVVPTTGSNAPTPNRLSQDLEVLDRSLEVLDALQQQTRADITKLTRRVEGLEMSGGNIVGGSVDATPQLLQTPTLTEQQTTPANGQGPVLGNMIRDNFDPYYAAGQIAPPDQMTEVEMDRLGQEINLSLRPTLRAGWLYSKQTGGDTTFSMRTAGVPTQLAISWTPKLRLRAGISPREIYLPDRTIDPRSTWSYQYHAGYTYKATDKWTLEGDLALTHFTQPGNVNVTGAQAFKYDFNDTWHTQFGFRRTALDNSLLAFAGQRARFGAWAGERLGQARDNSVFIDFSATPNRYLDFNLGYQFGWITGHEIPTNYRNQIFASAGVTVPIRETHSARLGLEALWFGFTDDATLGFFDITPAGFPGPVSNLNPVTPSPPGTRFGGYFSPPWFILVGPRLDLAGSFFNKRLEYRLGGGIGFQTFGSELENVATPKSLATNAQAVLTWNVTDWLALYGNIEYQNSGGLFERIRYGAGAILRPNFEALTPVIKP